MLDGTRVVDHFREQARWCEDLGSPFTAALLRRFAGDFEAGGPVHDLTAGWPTNPRKDALGLRLAGCLHHAVLTGEAPALAAAYPKARDDWDMDTVWPAARDWLAANTGKASDFLERAPQTNETRRSIILLPGFLELAARFGKPLRLLELGASAGLNLNWDAFSYTADGWSRPGTSPVSISTDWRGPPPDHLDAGVQVASRAACDLNPLDVSNADEARLLKCYTWADQPDRLARLDAAMALAVERGVTVERADAGDWLARQLATPAPGVVTVVYHSVFLIYPPKDQITRIMDTIRTAGDAATDDVPLAWLCYESEALFGGDRDTPKMQARLQAWPGGTARIYAQSDGHVTFVETAD